MCVSVFKLPLWSNDNETVCFTLVTVVLLVAVVVVIIRRVAVSHPLGYVWWLCFSIIPSSFARSFVCQLPILIWIYYKCIYSNAWNCGITQCSISPPECVCLSVWLGWRQRRRRRRHHHCRCFDSTAVAATAAAADVAAAAAVVRIYLDN